MLWEKPMDELIEVLFPELSKAEQNELLEDCCKVENAYLQEKGAKLYPGIEQMLADLKKEYFLAIVSNCQCGYIEAFLEHYGFGKYIDDIQCFGMNEVPKGENIRLVAERNHLEDAVYVGDIQGDYDASKAAGVKFIHAAYGFWRNRRRSAADRKAFGIKKKLYKKSGHSDQAKVPIYQKQKSGIWGLFYFDITKSVFFGHLIS